MHRYPQARDVWLEMFDAKLTCLPKPEQLHGKGPVLQRRPIKETILPINNLILFPKHHMHNEQSGLEEPEHSKSAGREEPETNCTPEEQKRYPG